MEVINLTQHTSIAHNVIVADTFWSRLKGLLGRPTLPQGEGLLLQPCNSVHGFGMKFTCEVLYLDQENQVLFIKTLKPWSRGPILVKAAKVLELPVGTVIDSKTRVGDTLLFS